MAADADVLWRPEVSNAILPLQAVSAEKHAHATSFDVFSLACRVTAVRTSENVQHILFANGPRRLQLLVTGVDLFRRPRLLTDAIVSAPLLERWHVLMRQFSAVARTGDLVTRLHPPDPRSMRLAFVLRVLDGWMARALQRDIADAIFGRQRVNADWTDPRDHLRDRIRRGIRRGRGLMQRGYISLLK